jgi:hypothetical protein
MGKAPLLWLNNLPAECITSWATLSWLFTTNYQATYNHPDNTHHLARVQMRHDETLREYTNCYFENCNTLEGVKDEDVIAYYKKGVTNIKLFEKIHEADTHTIADLMAYIDKLVDTQDVVMHDFKENTTMTVAAGRASDQARSMRPIHPDLLPSLKETSTWSRMINASSTATPSIP